MSNLITSASLIKARLGSERNTSIQTSVSTQPSTSRKCTSSKM